MSFKTRTIGFASASQKKQHQPSKKFKSFAKIMNRGAGKLHSKVLSLFVVGTLLVFGIAIVFKVTLAAYHFISELTPLSILEVVGKDLKKDEHNYTNILLLGDGGYVREGGGLIDTIMVASIDYEKNAVSLLSVPRDFYVGKNINLGLDKYGKINQIYNNYKDLDEEERFEKFKGAVGELFDLEIQYYMRIDFKGFIEIVDSLGGITIDAPEAIYDPDYPNDSDTGTFVFKLEAGLQEMDGKTALKYARSRHGTSDYDRAARQQLILEALRQKALSAGVLTDFDTLSNVYKAINDNFNSDLTLREMASLGEFAQKLDRSHLVSKQLKESPLDDGGLLYVPDRASCGGSWCLTPLENNLDLIHQYADLIFNHREIYYEPAKIEVLNATKTPGIAGEVASQLKRLGFDVEDVGNYEDEAGEKKFLAESLVEYSDWSEGADGRIIPKYQATLTALEGLITAKEIASDQSQLIPAPEGDQNAPKVYVGGGINLRIILGQDQDAFSGN